jgi:hypothetical protein
MATNSRNATNAPPPTLNYNKIVNNAQQKYNILSKNYDEKLVSNYFPLLEKKEEIESSRYRLNLKKKTEEQKIMNQEIINKVKEMRKNHKKSLSILDPLDDNLLELKVKIKKLSEEKGIKYININDFLVKLEENGYIEDKNYLIGIISYIKLILQRIK